MDNPLSVGRRVEVRPRTDGLARHYAGHIGFIVEINHAAGLYIVDVGQDEWRDVRVVLTEGEVEPA